MCLGTSKLVSNIKPVNVSSHSPELIFTEKRICSLNKPGGGLPLFLRSASAIIALKGEGGDAMPLNAFIFLFSGDNGKAFNTHKDKFEIDYKNQVVKLKTEYLGYFVGENGTMETASDKKRRKVLTDAAHSLADWMLNNGARPEEAKGTMTCDTFLI